MRAPVLPLLIVFIFLFKMSFAQTTLGISKDEKLFIGTASGEMAFADSIKGSWRKSWFSKGVSLMPGTLIVRACYFNADTAFVCGKMETSKRDDIICRTVNGGKSWEPVETGLNGRADDATFLDNGEAWLIVSGDGIVYTKDFGCSWTSLSLPNRWEQYTRIYFNNKREGIIGAEHNAIAWTKDTGNTWITIPTPLNQEKYNSSAITNDPAINRVAIFNNHLLAAQGALVFYSKVDSIDWKYMPGYTDFYTDADNSALFFKTPRDGFVKCDSHLQPVCSFDYLGNPYTAACRNGSLFIGGRKKIWQIDTSNKVRESPTCFSIDMEVAPTLFHRTGNNAYGSIGSKIYRQESSGGEWNYILTLPFATDRGNLTMKDTNTIEFSRYDDSLFYYSISDGKVEGKTHKEMFDSFCASSIKKIIFSQVSFWGDGREAESMVYILKGSQFVLVHKSPELTRYGPYLSDNSVTIDQKLVAAFVKKMPAIYNKKTTVDGLGFTPEQYDSCRRNILAFKAFLESPESERGSMHDCAFTYFGKNINFEKMLALVDSVRTIDPGYLNEFFWDAIALYEKERWSNSWPRVELVNTKNEVLEIKSFYDIPWTFYFPWDIKLNGKYFINTAIEINDFLHSVFPRFLEPCDRVKLIQDLVIDLYWRQRNADKN